MIRLMFVIIAIALPTMSVWKHLSWTFTQDYILRSIDTVCV